MHKPWFVSVDKQIFRQFSLSKLIYFLVRKNSWKRRQPRLNLATFSRVHTSKVRNLASFPLLVTSLHARQFSNKYNKQVKNFPVFFMTCEVFNWLSKRTCHLDCTLTTCVLLKNGFCGHPEKNFGRFIKKIWRLENLLESLKLGSVYRTFRLPCLWPQTEEPKI